MVSLSYERCVGEQCASEEEFLEFSKRVSIQEIFVSSYFDIKDFNQPIHYFLDDMYLALEYGRSIITNIYIQKNLINLHDNLFGIFNSEVNDYFYHKGEKTFFTADVNEGPGPGILFY